MNLKNNTIMHSKIFQIGLKPISKEDYVSPMDFYENSGDFADYIGEEYPEKERLNATEYLAEIFPELLDYVGDGTLRYKGMGTFLQDWADEIHSLAGEIKADNILKDFHRFRLSELTERTHKGTHSRFYIEDWNGCASPASDLIEFLGKQKEGTLLYVGAVIDFHF